MVPKGELIRTEDGVLNWNLKHSIALKESSGQVYRECVEKVRALLATGDIYPPRKFPMIRRKPLSKEQEEIFPSQRTASSGAPIGNEMPHLDSGRLTPAEAVAVSILLTESSALCQNWTEDDEVGEKYNQVFGFSQDGFPRDAINGFCDFGAMFSTAAKVREWIMHTPDADPRDVKGAIDFLEPWERFKNLIRDDGMRLGNKTADEIKKWMEQRVRFSIFYDNPHGYQYTMFTELYNMEYLPRVESAKHGIELARELYSEVLELASKELPTTLEPKQIYRGVKVLPDSTRLALR